MIAERENLVGHCPTHGWNLDDGKDGEGDDGASSDQVTKHLMMSTSTKLPPKTTKLPQKRPKIATQNNNVATKNDNITTKNDNITTEHNMK